MKANLTNFTVSSARAYDFNNKRSRENKKSKQHYDTTFYKTLIRTSKSNTFRLMSCLL